MRNGFLALVASSTVRMTIPRAAIGVMAILLVAPAALAVTDDLQCFTIGNGTLRKLKAVVDMTIPSIGVAPGCRLRKAKLYCLPAETMVHTGSAFDGKRPLEMLPITGAPAGSARICHQVRCKGPVGKIADQTASDRFGVHRLAKLKTSLLCMPVAVEAEGTPGCGDGQRDATETCDGADLGGATCQSLGYLSGTLGCTKACAHDVSACVPGFRVESPPVQIAGGQEITYCYHFRTPNTVPLVIKGWSSRMQAPAQRMLVFLATGSAKTPGTLEPCEFPGATNVPAADVPEWAYSAHDPEAQFRFPSDDGTGTPIGQAIAANQAAFVVIHHVNETAEPVSSQVELDVAVYDAGTSVTLASPFMAFNGNVVIPPDDIATCEPLGNCWRYDCPVPPGSKFFLLTSESNQLSIRTFIKDGFPAVFQAGDYLHPGAARFDPPFFSFATGNLTYQCNYANPTNRTVTIGGSPATDELCMALAFYFPSVGPKFCYNDNLIQ